MFKFDYSTSLRGAFQSSAVALLWSLHTLVFFKTRRPVIFWFLWLDKIFNLTIYVYKNIYIYTYYVNELQSKFPDFPGAYLDPPRCDKQMEKGAISHPNSGSHTTLWTVLLYLLWCVIWTSWRTLVKQSSKLPGWNFWILEVIPLGPLHLP